MLRKGLDALLAAAVSFVDHGDFGLLRVGTAVLACHLLAACVSGLVPASDGPLMKQTLWSMDVDGKQ